MADCTFCEIVEGLVPAYTIAENRDFLAFLDIHPVTEGHTLVIPKKHYRWVWEMPNIDDYMRFAQEIIRHYQSVTRNDLVYLLVLGDEIPHATLHILPNYNRDFQDALEECMHRAARRESLNIEDAYSIAYKYKYGR